MPDSCPNVSSCGCSPVFQVTPPNPPPPEIIFWNTQQCATASCPDADGPDATHCESADKYSSTVSQVAADNLAYAAALSIATANLKCGLAGQLNGLRWQIPCTGSPINNVCTCTDPSDQTTTAEGTPAQVYTVHARIRGVVECKSYAHDGIAGTRVDHLFTCANPAQTIPAAGGDAANEYALVISDPAATYFLNAALNTIPPFHPDDSQVVDYSLTFQVKTGATVKLVAKTVDSLQWANGNHHIANNAPPAPGVTEPYNGQWIELLVTGIF